MTNQLTSHQRDDVLAAVSYFTPLQEPFASGSPVYINICVFGDHDTLAFAASETTISPKVIGVGLAACPVDPTWTRGNILLGQTDWCNTAWDCANWVPQQWSFFVLSMCQSIPCLNQPGPLSVLISHKVARGRQVFLDEIQTEFARIKPRHFPHASFQVDGALFEDLGLIFDSQVCPAYASQGILFPDRTESPAMTFKCGSDGDRIVADMKVFRTLKDYVAFRVNSAKVKRSKALGLAGVTELKRFLIQHIVSVLNAYTAPAVFFPEMYSQFWIAEAAAKIDEVILYIIDIDYRVYAFSVVDLREIRHCQMLQPLTVH
ncbi:hypothetical protein HDU98_002307 [Podochytrium sp. JEL0797]|nr:hypothetical protein HDU98_002307 [Podochytrium sp. JEL0797]